MKSRISLFVSALLSCVMFQGGRLNAAEPIVFDNVAGLLSWTTGGESQATVATSIADGLLETSVSVGTDLTVSGPTSYTTIPEATAALMTYQPTTSNPGCVPGDMVEYRVKLKKGLTFYPDSVAFDAVKEGTDAAFFSWSYTLDKKESSITKYSNSANQVRRNNNANPKAPLTHVAAISSEGGREFSLRFYLSDVANNKKLSIGNIKIWGRVSGTEEVRSFVDFALDFTTNPYTVTKPATGLPAGVTVEGTWHDNQHGYNTTRVTVPVDGPVKVLIGNCTFSGTGAKIVAPDGATLASFACKDNCDGVTAWVYNSETPTTLEITTPQYCPSLAVEACELLPMVAITYYDTDGTLMGRDTVQGGSPLAYKYAADQVTVPEGYAFRGWFTSGQSTALKVAEGFSVQENLKLYARATKIEVPTSTSRFVYNLTKPYFYVEDHECIEIDGQYYNEHGWKVPNGGSLRVQVAGKCYVSVGNCQYSNESTATVTDLTGLKVAEFAVKGATDGAVSTFTYDGPATWLTITFPSGAYTHSVSVWNVVDFVEYDETTGYYVVAPSDVSSFLMALNAAAGRNGAKIFLPDGTYDLGETTLTQVSGQNLSIVGQSRQGTIILNYPPKDQEGIAVTATLLNTSSDLYLQDLTLRNAMTFTGATGRAVCLQDQGNRTICKNVSLESYQDTYYSHNNSAYFYFEDGEIHGVVDYVCGGGDVYFQGVTFVNEKIKDATIAAPNGGKKVGYVMNQCTIETLCNSFNLGRSWGTYSGLAWLNTTINQPSKLIKNRFTTEGMNCAADRFVEYNSVDAQGNLLTPVSNVLKFTHSTGNKQYETVLTAEQAAEYAIEKVFPDWRPEQIAAQLTTKVSSDGTTLSWDAVEGATAYALIKAGEVVSITKETSFDLSGAEASDYKVRVANGRGGFGPECWIGMDGLKPAGASSLSPVKAVYNLQGQPVSADSRGLILIVREDGTCEKRLQR